MMSLKNTPEKEVIHMRRNHRWSIVPHDGPTREAKKIFQSETAYERSAK